MTDQVTSLIERDEQQLSLLSVPEAILQAEEERGTYTAERYHRKQPHAYRAIVALLADGALGMHRIADMVRASGTPCSVNTVAAIRDREPAIIERAQKQLAQVAYRGARMAIEAIVDKLSDKGVLAEASLQQLGVISGILTDKGQVLSGGPTARMEVVRGATREDFEAFVEQVRAAQPAPAQDAEWSEPGADTMGLGGGDSAQKDEGAGGAGGADGPGGGGPVAGAADPEDGPSKGGSDD